MDSWLKRNAPDLRKKKTREIFSEEDIEFIKENYLLMTYKEIGENLGFTAQQIQGKVRNLKLPKKIRTIVGDYFHHIDTPLKAYFLGFIYADGWVVYDEEKSNYEFGMSLQSEDKYILDELNNQLGGNIFIEHRLPRNSRLSTGQVIHSNHSNTIRVFSKELVGDLISHDILPNKTKKGLYS